MDELRFWFAAGTTGRAGGAVTKRVDPSVARGPFRETER